MILVSSLVLGGCALDRGGDGPVDPGDLTVTAVANAEAVLVGATAVLSAEASGGSEPYAYRWDQNAGPVEVAPEPATAPEVTVGPLDAAGTYVFRVVVTDQQRRSIQRFVTITVGAGAVVDLQADASDIDEGASVRLTAEVTEGAEPLEYDWSLEAGPVPLDLAGEDSASFTTDPLTPPGEYTFAVAVTDARGITASDKTTVRVASIVSVETPDLALAGTPAELSASVNADGEALDFSWTVTSGEATVAEEGAASTTVTTAADETVRLGLTVRLGAGSGQAVILSREVEVVSVTTGSPRVRIETNFGDIVLELDGEAAPGHTGNMLAYVDAGFYDGLLFHRSACSENEETGACEPFVLQGGGYERVDGALTLKEPTRPPVMSEAPNGLTNATVYSVSLALRGGDPDSGTTQFFINLTDNGFLDDQGFTVFGRVVERIDVVDAVVALDRTESPILSGEVSLPVEDVIMERVSRVLP